MWQLIAGVGLVLFSGWSLGWIVHGSLCCLLP